MSQPDQTFSWESARKRLGFSPSEPISTSKFTFEVVSLEYQLPPRISRTSKIGIRSDSSRLLSNLTQRFDAEKKNWDDAMSNNPAFLSKNEEIADWPRSVRLRRDTNARPSGNSSDVSFVTLAKKASSVTSVCSGLGEDNGVGVPRVLV
jgi:hypothetical protein